MNLLIPSIYIFAISIVLFSFINLKFSIALYASYLILVPYLEFNVAGISLSYNLVNTLLLVVFFYHFRVKNKKNISFKLINPFLFLYLSLLLLSLFAWTTPWDVQFNSWRISFMPTCFLSFILWNMVLNDTKTLIYLKWAIIISIFISGIYGIFLTQLGGLNPYANLLSLFFEKEDMAEKLIGMESRLSFSSAGKIQSTMIHPMRWGLLLCFLFSIFTSHYLKTKNHAYWLLIGLIGLNILISGVRTSIAALAIGSVYFLVRIKNFKLLIFAILFISIFSVVVQSNDDLSSLFASFVDVSGTASNVQGSSISMRLDQFDGAIHEIKGVEFAGKGYGWSGYYQLKHGDHPKLLAFESLVFVVLCNSGFIGVLIWIIFFILLFRLQRNILKAKQDVFLMDAFVIIYAAYATGTGEYGYIQLFAFYYTYLLAYLFYCQEKNVCAKYKPYFLIRNKQTNRIL